MAIEFEFSYWSDYKQGLQFGGQFTYYQSENFLLNTIRTLNFQILIQILDNKSILRMIIISSEDHFT